MDNKATGSYYTPVELVESMVEFITDKNKGFNILEPSAGDGRFINSLIAKNKAFDIDSVELIKSKCEYIEEKFKYKNINIINNNFLKYSLKCKKKYDIIIGNPPYIDKKLLDDETKKLCMILNKEFNAPNTMLRNIWVSFVLASIKLLKENGAIFFVLPSEFLQVEYAKYLRTILETRFQTIEIFVFKENIFKNIQQDVCLVYMSNGILKNKPFIKYNILKDMNLSNIIYTTKIMKNKPLSKWSNAIISDENMELIKNISGNFIKISDIGYMAPGVVTGDNSYFLVNETFVRSKRLKNYVKKIVPKSAYIINKFILNEEDFNQLSKNGKDVYLLHLNGKKILPKNIKKYIEYGEQKGINKRYKCSLRNPWYTLPKFIEGDLLFYKRYDEFPRLVVNKCNICTTDIAYNIQVKEGYDIESLAFCFYNSLTLLLCEFNGRYYGGGVIELTPNEFRNVSIPYQKIDKDKIEKLDEMIRKNVKKSSIIEYVNSVLLSNIASEDEIKIIERLRCEYIKRRKKIKD